MLQLNVTVIGEISSCLSVTVRCSIRTNKAQRLSPVFPFLPRQTCWCFRPPRANRTFSNLLSRRRGSSLSRSAAAWNWQSRAAGEEWQIKGPALRSQLAPARQQSACLQAVADLQAWEEEKNHCCLFCSSAEAPSSGKLPFVMSQSALVPLQGKW